MNAECHYRRHDKDKESELENRQQWASRLTLDLKKMKPSLKIKCEFYYQLRPIVKTETGYWTG